MTRLRSPLCLLLWAVMLLSFAAPARAQTFPSRPIHLIMPYAPGGIVDFAGRVVAQKLGEVLGETVVAENRPGAGGMVGVEYVAHSAPDGYDLVIMDPAFVINPIMQKSMPYDILKDLVTVSIVNSSPEVLVVSPQLGIKTYAELVAYGKAHRSGIDAVNVLYKGVGPSYVDLISGKVQMLFSSIAGALPYASKGNVVALATTGSARSPVYPNLPTVAEAGLPGYDVDLWLGIYTPATVPPDVLAKLNSALAKALKDEQLKASFATFGLTPRGTTLAEGVAFTKSEYEKWKKVIDDGHITLE